MAHFERWPFTLTHDSWIKVNGYRSEWTVYQISNVRNQFRPRTIHLCSKRPSTFVKSSFGSAQDRPHWNLNLFSVNVTLIDHPIKLHHTIKAPCTFEVKSLDRPLLSRNNQQSILFFNYDDLKNNSIEYWVYLTSNFTVTKNFWPPMLSKNLKKFSKMDLFWVKTY